MNYIVLIPIAAFIVALLLLFALHEEETKTDSFLENESNIEPFRTSIDPKRIVNEAKLNKEEAERELIRQRQEEFDYIRTGRLYQSGLRKPMMHTYQGILPPYSNFTGTPGGIHTYNLLSRIARAEKTGELPQNWNVPQRESSSVLYRSGIYPRTVPDTNPPLGVWQDEGYNLL